MRTHIAKNSKQRPALNRARALTLCPILSALLVLSSGCATDQPARVSLETPSATEQPEPAARQRARAPVRTAQPEAPARPPIKTRARADDRALLEYLIPAAVSDRAGWAADIYTALGAMALAQSPDNFCAVIAIIEQESSFRADPSVPNLSQIAWQEIERQRERAGVPTVVMKTALQLSSPNGRTYGDRLSTVKTERELSDVFEDFIGMVPLGKTFFANRNPVRTGGPMQVSVAFAEKHAAAKRYPYPVAGSIRNEVFTRRGGVYFGIAHLLDYPASYLSHVYRFADFNAGHYASRNAAFQSAVSLASGAKLDLDGDLLRYDNGQPIAQAGSTELAVRALASRLEVGANEIRRDLERARTHDFERTRLYARVFALADRAAGKTVPRAVVPQIVLQSPKFTRKLTTAWFAKRVEDRQKRCLVRAGDAF